MMEKRGTDCQCDRTGGSKYQDVRVQEKRGALDCRIGSTGDSKYQDVSAQEKRGA